MDWIVFVRNLLHLVKNVVMMEHMVNVKAKFMGA